MYILFGSIKFLRNNERLKLVAAEDKIYFYDTSNRMQCCCSESCTDSNGQVVGRKLNYRCSVDDSLTKIL